MKTVRLFLVLSFTAAACAARSDDPTEGASDEIVVGPTSAYTPLSRERSLDACTMDEEFHELSLSGWQKCGVMEGFTFRARGPVAAEGQQPSIRTLAGKYLLPMRHLPPETKTGVIEGGYFGRIVEWRGRGLASATAADPFAGRVAPEALIVRYFHPSVEAPIGSFRGDSTLLVVKLTTDAVCVHSTVSGSTPNHNRIAREITDSQAFKDFACPRQFWEPNLPLECGVMRPQFGFWILKSLKSCNGAYALTQEIQGDAVLSEVATGRVLWKSGTGAPSTTPPVDRGHITFMQPNGQLVVLGNKNLPLFATPTAGNEGAFLTLGDDGALVVRSKANEPLWTAPRAED